jgi:hypothetical protein
MSKNGVLVRLTEERWAHIIEQHGELDGMKHEVLDAIAEPERVLAGQAGEMLAVRAVEVDKWLVVVYRELQGRFIITAFLTSRIRFLNRRQQLWP